MACPPFELSLDKRSKAGPDGLDTDKPLKGRVGSKAKEGRRSELFRNYASPTHALNLVHQLDLPCNGGS